MQSKKKYWESTRLEIVKNSTVHARVFSLPKFFLETVRGYLCHVIVRTYATGVRGLVWFIFPWKETAESYMIDFGTPCKLFSQAALC